MEYARKQEILRLLYLISLYDSGHIQMIQFLDEEITITYTNNKQTQFYFETVRAYNKDGFENKIADNLNTMLIVSEDPSVEGNEDAIVKYYSFDLDIEKNIDPKEGNNKDDNANFDLKEGKEVYNKGNQDKRKSNNIEKSVAKKNKISMAEESEDESEENVENGKLIEGKEE
ncbi:12003_t:CDS:2, partial [Dentiscutata erythropus]